MWSNWSPPKDLITHTVLRAIGSFAGRAIYPFPNNGAKSQPCLSILSYQKPSRATVGQLAIYAETLSQLLSRERGTGTLSYVKPAVGFTLPSAGVTPAPSEKKSQNGEDALLLSLK